MSLHKSKYMIKTLNSFLDIFDELTNKRSFYLIRNGNMYILLSRTTDNTFDACTGLQLLLPQFGGIKYGTTFVYPANCEFFNCICMHS